jgi:hypothetical protein
MEVAQDTGGGLLLFAWQSFSCDWLLPGMATIFTLSIVVSRSTGTPRYMQFRFNSVN